MQLTRRNLLAGMGLALVPTVPAVARQAPRGLPIIPIVYMDVPRRIAEDTKINSELFEDRSVNKWLGTPEGRFDISQAMVGPINVHLDYCSLPRIVLNTVSNLDNLSGAVYAQQFKNYESYDLGNRFLPVSEYVSHATIKLNEIRERTPHLIDRCQIRVSDSLRLQEELDMMYLFKYATSRKTMNVDKISPEIINRAVQRLGMDIHGKDIKILAHPNFYKVVRDYGDGWLRGYAKSAQIYCNVMVHKYSLYILGEPDQVGVHYQHKNLYVLPSDDPKRLRLGWVAVNNAAMGVRVKAPLIRVEQTILPDHFLPGDSYAA